jgi:hypothetical protein
MPQFTTSYIRQLSDGNPGGTTLGESATDKISFYNVTPVVQAGSIATIGTTAATTTTPFGFTQTQADTMVGSVNLIIAALKNVGITA